MSNYPIDLLEFVRQCSLMLAPLRAKNIVRAVIFFTIMLSDVYFFANEQQAMHTG